MKRKNFRFSLALGLGSTLLVIVLVLLHPLAQKSIGHPLIEIRIPLRQMAMFHTAALRTCCRTHSLRRQSPAHHRCAKATPDVQQRAVRRSQCTRKPFQPQALATSARTQSNRYVPLS